ncbi:MAG: hypothetical protein HY769_05890 [Candidatus Stahlbacteria bacterium]|nr:hypothetical protein [Candidatus Stahlbacteria bacterium]
MIGLFGLFEENAVKYIRDINEKVEIRVFLDDDVEVKSLKSEIEKARGVQEVKWLPTQYALQEFKKEFKIKYLPQSTVRSFPSSFNIVLDNEHKTPQYLFSFATKIEALDGVDEVVYGKEYVQTIYTVSKYFTWGSYGMWGILFFLFLLTLALSLNHKSLVLKDETVFLCAFGISKWRIKASFGIRNLSETIILSGAAIGIIYCGYRFVKLPLLTTFLPNNFILAFVGGCGIVAFVASFIKRI